MALIKCTACGHMISDKAKKCPKCGCPTTKKEKKSVQIEEVQPRYVEKDDDGKSRKWLYAIIALLLVILVGGGFYFFYYNHQKQKTEEREKFVADSLEKARKDSIEAVKQKEEKERLEKEEKERLEKEKKLKMEACLNYVKKFYRDYEKNLDEGFLRKHCTSNAIRTLEDEYGYECEGSCLATWIFFYEEGTDGKLVKREFVAKDENTCVVNNIYNYGTYSVTIGIVEEDGKLKINSINTKCY